MEAFNIESKTVNNLSFEILTSSYENVGEWIQQLEEWLRGRD
jgi:hypothetical protein